jgi:hypothetical protein
MPLIQSKNLNVFFPFWIFSPNFGGQNFLPICLSFTSSVEPLLKVQYTRALNFCKLNDAVFKDSKTYMVKISVIQKKVWLFFSILDFLNFNFWWQIFFTIQSRLHSSIKPLLKVQYTEALNFCNFNYDVLVHSRW